VRRIILVLMLLAFGAIAVAAQQPAEQRASLNQPAAAADAKGAPAIEAKLLTTMLKDQTIRRSPMCAWW